MTPSPQTSSAPPPILDSFRQVRQDSLDLCRHLEIEDYGLQAMPDVSPPKWHLAHVTWFFETFILKPFAEGYQPHYELFEYMFNSYYHGVGKQYPRPRRGLLSRPTVNETLQYRQYVDEAMSALLAQEDHPQRELILQRCELGLNHEQQHQELLCTDIKYSFSFNPLYPSLAPAPSAASPQAVTGLKFIDFDSSDQQIGHSGDGFYFDNEVPRHRYHVPAFSFANRLISNGEFLAFMEDRGYQRPELWLSDGWTWNRETEAQQPRYWQQQDGEWFEYTLYGLRPLDLQQPASHISYYEADAYARWYGKRLPSEQEWESVAQIKGIQPAWQPVRFHPQAADTQDISQMFAGLWQWTRSAYSPYPGYRAAEGAIGEYNGKFMCNQLVLRGSSCVTPTGHARSSYRNFFYPKDQWQFTGIRLADDL